MAWAIQQQPVAVSQLQGAGWMQMPPPLENCPPGLQYLAQVDRIICQQIVELLEAFTGWETSNKYAIKNIKGQQLYYAFEESNILLRQMLGPSREFTIHIVDNLNQEVMKIYRPFVFCCAGCCWCANCCGYTVQVEAPPGQIIGIVRQRQSACSSNFDVCDEAGNAQLQ